MKKDKMNDERVQKKIVKTIGIENIATRENDEQLTSMMIGRSTPL